MMSRLTTLALLASLLSGCGLPMPALSATASSGTVTAASSLSSHDLKNLVALTRLLGYVKYFHPSDEAGAVDWEAFTVHGIRKIRGLKDPKSLATALQSLVAPIAPTVQVFAEGNTPALPSALQRPTSSENLKLVTWIYFGVGGPGMTPFSKRIYLGPDQASFDALGYLGDSGMVVETPSPSKPFTASLGSGLTCKVPTALYVHNDHTLPTAAETPVARFSGGNVQETHLATTMAAWTAIQHFYPNLDFSHVDWLAELPGLLQEAAAAPNEATYKTSLYRLLARIQDGHAFVFDDDFRKQRVPAINFNWVQNQLIVTGLVPQYNGPDLKAGEVITAIDGVPIQLRVKQLELLQSGNTPQYVRQRALRVLMAGPANSTVTLSVRGDRGDRSITLMRNVEPYTINTEPHPTKIKEVSPGVLYVGVGQLTDQDFGQALPLLESAKGLIIDLREYPDNLDMWQTLMPLLIGNRIDSQRFETPLYLYPDQIQRRFESDSWSLDPAPKRLQAKVAFLSNGGSVSQQEMWLQIAKQYRLGPIVGEPTAGTDGTMVGMQVSRGYRISWTGQRMFDWNGQNVLGHGIEPTVPVSPTLAGIRAGKDEILEQAIKTLSQ